MPCLVNGGCLDHRLAKIAIQHFQSTSGAVRVTCWAQNVTIARNTGGSAPDEIATIEEWLARIIMQICTAHRFRTPIKKPALQQFGNDKPHATGGMEMVHIGAAIWINSGQQRCDF